MTHTHTHTHRALHHTPPADPPAPLGGRVHHLERGEPLREEPLCITIIDTIILTINTNDAFNTIHIGGDRTADQREVLRGGVQPPGAGITIIDNYNNNNITIIHNYITIITIMYTNNAYYSMPYLHAHRRSRPQPLCITLIDTIITIIYTKNAYYSTCRRSRPLPPLPLPPPPSPTSSQVHTYIHTHTHTHTYILIHTYSYIHTHTYIHTYIYTYTHTYTHTYIHTYIHTHTHTYIHTQTGPS
jgi:hypothetical protein